MMRNSENVIIPARRNGWAGFKKTKNMSKIFISIASKEKALGDIFSQAIDNVFQGNIKCSLLDLKPGDEWKRKLKENLQECDILVSFLTPLYIERPWAYVEWSAFWFCDNKHTILILPEQNNASINQIFDPFHDVQAAFMNDEESMRNTLQGIQQISGITGKNVNSEGNELSKKLSAEYDELLLKRKTGEYAIYRNDITKLPVSDAEVRGIAIHFYNIHESETFFNISERIISEEIKYEMAKYILSKKDITTFTSFVDLIDTNDKLLALLKYLVYQESQTDTPIIHKIINKIKATSEDALLPFVKDLVRNKLVHSSIFGILTKALEKDLCKRNLYTYLHENGIEASILENVLQSIDSNVEKGKIAVYYALRGDTNAFKGLVDSIDNSSEKIRLFRKLHKANIQDGYLELVISQISNSVSLSDLLLYSKENNVDNRLVDLIIKQREKVATTIEK
jgi:hypothetical protein